MSLRVRHGTPQDALAIGTLHVNAWRAAYAGVVGPDLLERLRPERRAAVWAERMADPDCDVLVACLDGRVAGFASVSWGGSEVAELEALYVAPDRIGTGLGGLLHDRARARALQRGARGLVLWVLAANPRARAFYERRGWVRDGRERAERMGATAPLQVAYRWPPERVPPDPLELAITCYQRSAWRQDTTTCVDTPDLFRTRTLSHPGRQHNKVRGFRSDPAEADARIAEILADHAARGSAMEWVVTPRCRPHDLVERLLAAGCTDSGEYWALVRDTATPFPPSEGVRTRTIGLDEVDAFAVLCRTAWGLPEQWAIDIASETRRLMRTPVEPMRWSVATLAGRPVGTSAMQWRPEAGYLMGAAVLPDARGQGVYRALLEHRRRELVALGVPRMTLIGMASTSGPICERQGFERVGSLRGLAFDP